MILVTGGLGFIGRHTARALLDAGESCVITRYRVDRDPAFLAAELGRRVFIEPLDLTDRAALLALGERHRITGIVHLAEGGVGLPDPSSETPLSAAPLLNVLHAAQLWGVPRVTVASAIGVYIGVAEVPLREDAPLPMTATHPIELMKKTSELLCGYLAARLPYELVTLRIGAIYGPLYANLASNLGIGARLIHAAVAGRDPGFGPGFQPYALDGADWCYATDCARAIALVQLAPPGAQPVLGVGGGTGLRHRVYNIGTGYPTRNGDFVAALRRVLPEARVTLPDGYHPEGPGQPLYLDTTRLRADTGFAPEYDVERGVSEYVRWLRAGNEY
jgi:UDP-glucose 4-epimerase